MASGAWSLVSWGALSFGLAIGVFLLGAGFGFVRFLLGTAPLLGWEIAFAVMLLCFVGFSFIVTGFKAVFLGISSGDSAFLFLFICVPVVAVSVLVTGTMWAVTLDVPLIFGRMFGKWFVGCVRAPMLGKLCLYGVLGWIGLNVKFPFRTFEMTGLILVRTLVGGFCVVFGIGLGLCVILADVGVTVLCTLFSCICRCGT